MSAAPKPPSEALPVAALDDPHLQPYAKRPGAAQAVAAVSMAVGIVAFVGFAVTYWVSDSTQWLAAFFGVGMVALGFGITAWGKYLMPQGPFVEERHDAFSSEDDRAAMTAAVVERGGMVVKRRKVLGALSATGAAVFGIVLLFPLLRSLGPRPGNSLSTTNWRRGSRVVTVDGRAVHVDDLEVGGVLTVLPAGYDDEVSNSVDQTILIRLDASNVVQQPPGRTDWQIQGIVAYSKMCTHLGCPVGLYQEQTQQLVCPCHQSIFNVRSGAIPEFGPAPRPLPQLPLTADADGYLVAAGGYQQPVGPGFWERP